MSLPFVVVTGNPNKRQEVERILGVEIETVDIDLPEIQSNDLVEVLRFKAEEAWSRVGRPLVVEETGLELEALGGFPGPFIKWMLAKIGPEGVAQTALALNNPRVSARCALMLRDETGEVLGVGSTPGQLVLPPRGETGFGWDPVFVPDGHEKTCAELGDEVKDRVGHRGDAWRVFSEQLLEHRGWDLNATVLGREG